MGEYMGNAVRRLIEGREGAQREREARLETSIPRQVSWKGASDIKKETSSE